MKIQSFRLYFTSRFSSRRVRQTFIGKECGVHLLSIKTTQILPGSPKNIQKSTGIHLKKLTYTQKKKKKKKKNQLAQKKYTNFKQQKSKKFYGSSKSRESWLEKLRVTQLLHQVEPHLPHTAVFQIDFSTNIVEVRQGKGRVYRRKSRITIVSLDKIQEDDTLLKNCPYSQIHENTALLSALNYNTKQEQQLRVSISENLLKSASL